MFNLIIYVPVAFAVLLLLHRRRGIAVFALLASAAIFLTVSLGAWFGIFPMNIPPMLSAYFMVDDIGLFFLIILSIVFAATALYSLFYFKAHHISSNRQASYTSAMLIFVWAMAGVVLASHLALLWVFVEATTLSSAVLIYFDRSKSSLEAAWKYVFICSVGIALAFVGIIILSMASRSIGSLYFSDLYAHASEINPFWLKMSFAFILVGFGTKVGVAPLHAWLPDAHSEAPSPVSALLSGTLLNTALLGLIRVHELMLQAHLQFFSNNLLLLIGFASLFISAVFMLGIVNYKRMLAYSSIENMGILFIGLSMGKAGIFAAVLHSVAHSFSKTSLFLTSGNILHLYQSKNIKDVRAILRQEPISGWMWVLSFLAIAGMPPFPTFLSKFLLISAFFENGYGWLSIPFFILIAVVIFGMGGAVFKMAFNDDKTTVERKKRLSLFAYLPQFSMLLLMLAIGVNLPEKVLTLLHNAAAFLK